MGVPKRGEVGFPMTPVAAGPFILSMIPVSPFPSPVACLASPISAIAWRTPTQGPQAHRSLLTAVEKKNSSKSSFNNFSLFQANEASSAKGVACDSGVAKGARRA